MTPEEAKRVQGYLRSVLNPGIELKVRARAGDSAEVYVGEEFIAVCYRIDDEGETSYQLQMSILAEDLD
ncbi:DUF3126 family protein [bacterium]|nr:DUF3126 family protein [bacterium]